MNESSLKLQDHKIARQVGFRDYKVYGSTGDPDTLYVKGTVSFFVERKIPGKKLRPEQIQAQARILKDGGYAYAISDTDGNQMLNALYEVVNTHPPIFASQTFFAHMTNAMKRWCLKPQKMDEKLRLKIQAVGLCTADGKPTVFHKTTMSLIEGAK